MFRTFIQMLAMILTLEASFFLLKTNLGLSPQIIAELSVPRYGYHEEILKSLSCQSADTRVGLILLLVSFALQMGNALWPLRWSDFNIDLRGVFISLICGVIVFAAGYWYSRSLSKTLYEESTQLVKTKSAP